jgi:hypothetical protein
LRSEHRSSVIADRPPNRDQARAPTRRFTLRVGHAVCHWRTYAALDSAGKLQTRVASKSLEYLCGTHQIAAFGGRSLEDSSSLAG